MTAVGRPWGSPAEVRAMGIVQEREDELKRLRAGADSAPPEFGTVLTPAQLWHRLLQAHVDERLQILGHLQVAAHDAAQCVMADHAGQLLHLGARLPVVRQDRDDARAVAGEVLAAAEWRPCRVAEQGIDWPGAVRHVTQVQLDTWRARAGLTDATPAATS
jgi:hypothetical protein